MTPLQTTITGCDTREVTTKDGRKFPLHEVYDHTGQAWVVKRDVWNFAQQLKNQAVQMQTRVEQNGGFTNYYVDGIVPLGAAPSGGYAHPLDNPAGVTQQESVALNAGWDPYQGAPPPSSVGARPQPQDAPRGPAPTSGPDERELSIYRQTAAKVAAWLSTADAESQFKFWSNLPEIMTWFKRGDRPDWVLAKEVAMLAERSMANGEQKSDGEQFAEKVVGAAQAAQAMQDDIPF
jgi:hypothetical protein